jgi:hypothetical protein
VVATVEALVARGAQLLLARHYLLVLVELAV